MTLEVLINRILKYKESKPSNSAKSLGMFFRTSEKQYFFDTGTGKIFLIDANMMKFLQALIEKTDVKIIKDIVAQGDLKLEDILECIEKEDLLKGISGDNLYSNDYLENVKKKICTECSQIILELTGACNLRCTYCIYGSTKIGFREFNGRSMSKEIIEKSVQYLSERGKQDVYISFYGGEPLLRFDLMKYAIEYARKHITNKNLHFGFTTNLTLMTEEIASYLVRVPNLSLVFSIDGPEAIHNASRVDADGKGSFEKAMKGYEIFKKSLHETKNHSVSVNFNAVFMVPYDIDKLHKINGFLNSLCEITPQSQYTMSYPTTGSIPEELKQYAVTNHSMWENMVETALQSENLLDIKNKGIVDSLMTIHQRPLTEMAAPAIPMNGCCIPGTKRLYIDTQGDMYACERINKSPKLGNILKGIDLELVLEKYYYEYSAKSIKYCCDCWAAKMCPVCYANRMDEDGILEDAHIYCEEMKEFLAKQFSLYHEILEKTPEKLAVLKDVVIT